MHNKKDFMTLLTLMSAVPPVEKTADGTEEKHQIQDTTCSSDLMIHSTILDLNTVSFSNGTKKS